MVAPSLAALFACCLPSFLYTLFSVLLQRVWYAGVHLFCPGVHCGSFNGQITLPYFCNDWVSRLVVCDHRARLSGKHRRGYCYVYAGCRWVERLLDVKSEEHTLQTEML